MPKNKKKDFFKKTQIVLLIILTLSILFLLDYRRTKQGKLPYLRRWLPPYDYTFQSHQIDMAIELSLINLGLTSEDIIKSYREEKESGRKKWIFVYKEIKIPLEADFGRYVEAIEKEIETAGGRILLRSTPEEDEKSLRLVLGIKNIPTATVILKARPRAKIAIIIDDVGYGGMLTEKLLSLPFPVTLAILPHLNRSGDIARRAHHLGYEVILHLPMESIKPAENRGEGIIYVGMSKEDIGGLIKKSLVSVPYAVGVNNHMGSRLCQNPEVMEIILAQLKKRNLYFVDSLVIASSQAYQIAQKMGIPSGYRRTFLDNRSDPDYIRAQLQELEEKAIAEEEAIGIGHCRRNTLEVLAESVPEMEKEGIQFVFASELVK